MARSGVSVPLASPSSMIGIIPAAATKPVQMRGGVGSDFVMAVSVLLHAKCFLFDQRKHVLTRPVSGDDSSSGLFSSGSSQQSMSASERMTGIRS